MPDISGKHIVSTAWLADHLDASDVVVIDASWHLPAEKRDPKAEYRVGHIPGARYFDIDEISDKSSPLPHMLPTADHFAACMRALGVGRGDCVIAYDASAPGVMSAGRAWWMLRVFGHENVALLDGGLKKWKAEGRPLSAEMPAARTAAPFVARLNRALVRTLSDMQALVQTGSEQIADARSGGRFAGRDPEPRPGLRSGHMPGARSVPFSLLLRPDGTLRSTDELREVFEDAEIDLERPIVTSCGSGVSAAVLSLALAVLGRPDTGLYDGSWSEWGQESIGTEVETGA